MRKKNIENNNILLVANYKSDVGYAWWLMEGFWAEISEHFSKSNRNCVLIYPKVNAIPNVLRDSPVIIAEHDFSNRSFVELTKLFKLIKKNMVGYIYLTDKSYYSWFYLLLRLFGIKKIVLHDHMPGERLQVPFYKKKLKRIIHFFGIFSCDHYIGVSSFVRNRMIEVACVPERKSTYIHNGIKMFEASNSTYAHEEFNIPKDAKIIVNTGRATFYKGVDILIKCANVLINEKGVSNLYFLHVGDGPDLKSFRDMSVDLGVNNNFIFAGFRQDLTSILPSCDFGIQVSHGEAFSLSILEYLCAGLVTLAPDNCGNSEAITNGKTGILFTPGSVSEIVDQILCLLEDEVLTKSLKEAGRKSVVENFTYEACNKKLLSQLEKTYSI